MATINLRSQRITENTNENVNQQSRQLRMKAGGDKGLTTRRTALGEIGNNTKTQGILGQLIYQRIYIWLQCNY